MEHGSGGVTLEQLAARLAITEDALTVALAASTRWTGTTLQAATSAGRSTRPSLTWAT